MARVKISIPDQKIFSTSLIVTIADINYGKHLGNDKVLTLMHEARMRWIRSLGFEDETKIVNHIGIIIGDAAIEYKSEGFYGDEIEITLAKAEEHKYGFDLFYLLTRKSDNAKIAKGKTGTLFFDYDKKKLTGIPESFTEALKP